MEDRSDESSAILSVTTGKLVAVAVCRLVVLIVVAEGKFQ